MGWNDWNTFGCNVNAQLVEQTADTIVSQGLQAADQDWQLR
jgi:alpha-galactosidase